MGLFGLFFNKILLKLILIVAAIFLALRTTGWLVSLIASFGPVVLTLLLAIALPVITLLTARIDRLRFLSSPLKLLSITLVPLMLLYDLVSTSVPAPTNLLLEFAAIPLVLTAYSAYRDRFWIWKESSTFQIIQRRYRKLSKEVLLPKGIESGHVVFNSGRRGFRVLRFIEITGNHSNPKDMRRSIEGTHVQLARGLTRHLDSTRKSDIEVSYEFYCHNEAPQIVVTLACEGRNYRECRARVDESTVILSQKLGLNRLEAHRARIVDDNIHAQRVLMMPLLTTHERLRKVENDDHNARLIFTGDSERPIRLRAIRLTDLHSKGKEVEASLFQEVIRLALADNRSYNFACVLHIKPITNSTLEKELTETNKTYQSAITQVVEEASNGFFSGKEQRKRLLSENYRKIANASRALEEAKNQLRSLKQAEESGYYGVSLILVGEPATVENAARKLKSKIMSWRLSPEPSIELLPPRILQAVIRRDLGYSLDRLSGHELAYLLQS